MKLNNLLSGKYMRMNKVIKLVFLFTIIVNTNIIAQVPGYMGKRFMITGNTYSAPNYFLIFDSGFESNNTGPSFFKLSYNFEASYVVSKHIALGVNLGFFNTRNLFLESGVNEDYNSSSYYYNSDHYYVLNSCRLSGYSLGFSYKYYIGNWIAPLGNYLQLDLLRSNYKMSDFSEKKDLYKLTNTENVKLSSLGLKLTYGKSRVYFDRIIVTTGLQIGITEGVLMTTNYDSNIETDYYDNPIKDLRANARVWYGWSTIFNFHLGLGFLAF